MSETLDRTPPLRASRAGSQDAILAAAETVFAERGYDGATTAAIAVAAGLPKANVHYYFATKEQLYRRVIARVLEAWLDAADAFDAMDSAQEALTRYIAAKMDLARERPHGSRVFAKEIMRGAPVAQDFLVTTLKPWVEARGAVIERWIRPGAAATGRPEDAVLCDLGHDPALRRLRPPDRHAERRSAALGGSLRGCQDGGDRHHHGRNRGASGAAVAGDLRCVTS